MTENVCLEMLEAYPISTFIHGTSGTIGIVYVCLGIIYLFNASLMLFWIHQQRIKALQGMDGAAMYVIFPVYTPFMWMSVLSDITLGFVLVFFPLEKESADAWAVAASLALAYAFQHFVLEGVAFIMMQYGCGYQAARRSASWALVWATFTFISQLISFKYGGQVTGFVSDIVWNLAQLVFYFSLWMASETRLFRRPAVISYAKFWAIFRIAYIISESLITYSGTGSFGVALGYCGSAFGNILLFPIAKPYVIYSTLLADSKWWQGIGQKKQSSMSSIRSSISGRSSMTSNNVGAKNFRASKANYEQLRNPLIGVEVAFNDALELAQEVDNLREQGTVKLLNFAYIQLEKKKALLGSGSFSKVYPGRYRGDSVAIKMLFTPDLNPEVIRRCSNEASILSGICHENVVFIYGVAVLPPSVCIVLERCEFGSLSDVIRGSEVNSKPPMRLTLSDRMFLAWGCAKGLAALHESSTSLCHRDIKSFNFLVDGQLVVKIADLELGQEISEENEQSLMNSHRAIMASWQAPEVITGLNYFQSSDVYSLSLVLWEIIATHHICMTSERSKESIYNNPGLFGKIGIPFGESRNQKEIHEKILSGMRPVIPPGYNPEYVDIMIRGWSVDYDHRPLAKDVATVLERCWTQCLHRYVYETSHVVDLTAVKEVHQHHLLSKHSLRQTSTPPQMIRPPPATLLSALANMQQESAWVSLESEGAFLVVAAEDPYYILWATKKWIKLTGFVLNEILACDVSAFEGPRSNKILLSHGLHSASKGVSKHLVTTHYRRDGTSFKNSMHIFPVYRASEPLIPYVASTDQSTLSTSAPVNPRLITIPGPPDLPGGQYLAASSAPPSTNMIIDSNNNYGDVNEHIPNADETSSLMEDSNSNTNNSNNISNIHVNSTARIEADKSPKSPAANSPLSNLLSSFQKPLNVTSPAISSLLNFMSSSNGSSNTNNETNRSNNRMPVVPEVSENKDVAFIVLQFSMIQDYKNFLAKDDKTTRNSANK